MLQYYFVKGLIDRGIGRRLFVEDCLNGDHSILKMNLAALLLISLSAYD